jgi:arylsulfatase
MAIYAAMVSIVDKGVGRITGLLDEQGIADDTIVIFISDNGACPFPVNNQKDQPGSVQGGRGSATSYDYPWANASATPFRFFKRWAHEGGINVPMIIRYPGVVGENKIYSTPAHVMDIMPTCLDYTGSDRLTEMDGVALNAPDGYSMRGIFAGEEKELHPSLCWEHAGNRAIRSGDWKLVYDGDPAARKWELYNIRKDRNELHNVIDENPGIAADLLARYEQWMKDYKVVPTEKLNELRQRNN